MDDSHRTQTQDTPPAPVQQPRRELVVTPLDHGQLGEARYDVVDPAGSGQPWVVVVLPSGPLCECPAFAHPRKGRPRSCKHIEAVTRMHGAVDQDAPDVSPDDVGGNGGPGLDRDVPAPERPALTIEERALQPTMPASTPSVAADAAERAVLSGILLAQTVPPEVAALLSPASFAREAHRLFYQAMLAIAARGDPVDPLTLAASLNGDLDRAGGIEYIASIIDDVPTAAHVASHASIVRGHAQRRELAALGRQLERAASDPGIDVARTRPAVDRAAALLAALADPAARRFHLLTVEELRAVPARGWLLDQHVPAGGLAVLYGAAGVGKSFVALAQACAVAAGTPWLRWATHPGPVVFAAAEGGWGLERRLRAWQEAEGIAELPRLRILPEPVNLLTPSDVDALLASVAATFTDQPALFVFDTLAGSMAGGDENATQDMNLVVDQARRITRATGAAVYLIHHTGRDETRQKSERGSTALRGGADVMFRLTGEDGALTLENDKQRDKAPLEPLQLRLHAIAGSCVVQPTERQPSQPTLTRSGLQVLRQLWECFEGGETTVTPWFDVSQVSKATFHRSRKLLVEMGYVTHRNKRYVVSTAGETLLKDGLTEVSRRSHETSPDGLTHLGGPIEGPRVRPGDADAP